MDTAWVLYLVALVLTIVIETGLACFMRRDRIRRLLVDVPLMNLVTHPLLHVGLDLGMPLVAGELLVMAAEAVVYRKVTRLSLAWSIGMAVACNLVTWLLGYVMWS